MKHLKKFNEDFDSIKYPGKDFDFNSEEYPEGYLKVPESDLRPNSILKYNNEKVKIKKIMGKGIGSVAMVEYITGPKTGQIDNPSVRDLRPGYN